MEGIIKQYQATINLVWVSFWCIATIHTLASNPRCKKMVLSESDDSTHVKAGSWYRNRMVHKV
ncbi:hypothetical protein KC844_03275 [Proteus mirabilis]|uniref:hypothetical protein n=1 Tax=Morganellaceae TaxID=1903414 RepID=UPI001C07BB42|nr:MULTISPECIES: hypothetical protein [Morganellaceae]ELR5097714.1 hypothetical protein [Providencia rettgeri]MBU3052041.1 hypothetical protein [Proteus mirabilis]WBA59257.1 hypothetical protein O7C57_20445 [Providencia sp. 21OH12SH02B-Prov]